MAVKVDTLAERLARPLRRFLAIEAASSVLLLLATLVALALANSPWREAWAHLWHAPLAFRLGEAALSFGLAHVVNEGLMAIFFFVVGLEIKRELVVGELATRERAMLPVFGALGGMLAPAAIYLLLQPGGEARAGWAIPMATDIAFAVAALALLGPRVPSGLKVFLLALAIVDDLGAVTVIALFYTEEIRGTALLAAVVGLGGVWSLQRAGVRAYAPYFALGAAVWLATLLSGVHATVAGVMLGLLTPVGGPDAQEESPLRVLENALHPWVAFGVMPVFALANAGVTLHASTLGGAEGRVALAVAVGLLLGKPLGIALFAQGAVRLGLAARPAGVTASTLVGAGLLGGIGFTMALFITALAFGAGARADAAKLGVLSASALAAVLGVLVLARSLPRRGGS